MDLYAKIVVKIIQSQEAIIGPVAVEQAQLIPQLHIDWSTQEVNITDGGPKAVDMLVTQYARLFGQTSVEVCKEAAAPLLRQLQGNQLPQTLL